MGINLEAGYYSPLLYCMTFISILRLGSSYSLYTALFITQCVLIIIYSLNVKVNEMTSHPILLKYNLLVEYIQISCL